MKALESPNFSRNDIERYFASKIRKKGIIKRETSEEMIVTQLFWRPFRIVRWHSSEGGEVSTSLVDEALCAEEMNDDESLLLWRPKYTVVELVEIHDAVLVETIDEYSVKKVVDALIKRRNDAQQRLYELEPEVHAIQADRRVSASFILPRTPGGLRRDEEIMSKRQPDLGIMLATSIVMNCPEGSEIIEATLDERVLVGTVLAKYTEIETGKSRNLHLEMPGAETLRVAERNANALTRLCSKNENCRCRVQQQASI